jgi:site-specific DNA-methyltransferase (adenine-specific)
MSLTHLSDSQFTDGLLWEAEMSDAAPEPFFEDAGRGLRLYRGDALELLRRAKEGIFDLIFADPPYFLSNGGVTCHAGKMVSVNKGMWDRAETFEAVHPFNLEWLGLCRRLLKPHGSIWVTGTAHNIYSVGFAMQTLGFKILNDIAWYKVNPPPNLACRYFTHATETILWARRDAKARHTFNYQEMKRENGGKQMQSLWSIKPPAKHEKRYGKHPTQKPEALLDRILRASTNPRALVLDPFCGSGTTGVICARLGRQFVGIDLMSDYLEIAVARLRDEITSDQFAFSFTRLAVETIWIETAMHESRHTTWAEIVSTALTELGGEAHLQEINSVVKQNPRTRKNQTWPSTIRRVVRQSACFEPIGRGRYRLRHGTVNARALGAELPQPLTTSSRRD